MRFSPLACTALVISVVFTSACTTAPRSAEDDADSKYVRTGSHIPTKDKDGGFAKSQDVQSVQDEMRRSSGVGAIAPSR